MALPSLKHTRRHRYRPDGCDDARNGYETIRAIRQLSQFRSLPMIALTKLKPKGDRQKCIEAGASDYITKPVDTEQLLSSCVSGSIGRLQFL